MLNHTTYWDSKYYIELQTATCSAIWFHYHTISEYMAKNKKIEECEGDVKTNSESKETMQPKTKYENISIVCINCYSS